MTEALRRLGRPLVLVLTIAALLLATRALRSTEVSRPSPTAGAGAPAEGVRGLVVLPDDGRGPLLVELRAATRSIDVEVYILSDREVVDALLAAEDRGVQVRVILDREPFGGAGDSTAVVTELRAGGVDVQWGAEAFRYTHVKMIVVDGRTALILTLNLSESAFTRNRELGVITTVPDEVSQASAIFAADWAGNGDAPAGPLVVSPVTSRAAIAGLISGATRSLDVYAEVVRDPGMVDALAAAEQRGVKVRVLIPPDTDPAFATIASRLRAGGVELRELESPYVHAKAILADGARLFVGSENLTATSLDRNREVGIILTDSTAIARMSAAFAADWSASTPVPAP